VRIVLKGLDTPFLRLRRKGWNVRAIVNAAARTASGPQRLLPSPAGEGSRAKAGEDLTLIADSCLQ